MLLGYGDKKSYVVAGDIKSGTTAAVLFHIHGGIPANYRELLEPDRPYPYQVYEPRGGDLRETEVYGKVTKQFYSTMCDNFPASIRNVHVMYMLRDYDALTRAHPGVHKQPYDYSSIHLDHIARLSKDPRVSQIMCVDYDDLIDQPSIVAMLLRQKGWEIDIAGAVRAIRQGMRHASKNDDIYTAGAQMIKREVDQGIMAEINSEVK